VGGRQEKLSGEEQQPQSARPKRSSSPIGGRKKKEKMAGSTPKSFPHVHRSKHLSDEEEKRYGQNEHTIRETAHHAADKTASSKAHHAAKAHKERIRLELNKPVWASRKRMLLWYWNPFLPEKLGTKYQLVPASGYTINGKPPWEWTSEWQQAASVVQQHLPVDHRKHDLLAKIETMGEYEKWLDGAEVLPLPQDR
jgi:hypothetical protein